MDSDCRLCEIVNKPEQHCEVQDTTLDQTHHFQWLPGLGSFIEGYSLIVSKNHVHNTGCFDVRVIHELELFIQRIRRKLSDIYKKNSIVVEHGSMGNHNHAGSCIDHHHLHIFPVDLPDMLEFLSEKFVNHASISSMKDLIPFNENQVPYIYYNSTSQKQYVFEVPILAKQYLRQVIAVQIGHPQDWDWRDKPFLENINLFVTKIGKTRMEK